MVSAITSIYTPESVLLCAAATVAATVGLALFAMTTKSDFTSVGNSVTGNSRTKVAFGLALFNVIFWVSLINIFFVRSSMVDLVLSVALSIVYMIYLLIDIQLVMGGKRNNLSLDNYVMGAMIIYVDIISLFIKLLKIFGKKKDE
jgi:FtsH-binding integral membrane protein